MVMATTVDVPRDTSALDAVLRLVLPRQRMHIQLEEPLSDGAFHTLCARNEGLSIEQNPDGTLTLMSPTGGLSSARNSVITRYLDEWSAENKDGVSFDSNGLFKISTGSIRAPDAAWVRRERFMTLSESEREGILPLSPDFLIELRSPSDPLDVLKSKMNEYMRAGVRLGWLIDPLTETVSIYQPDTLRTTLDRPDTVAAETVVNGFTLPMKRIWDPLAE